MPEPLGSLDRRLRDRLLDDLGQLFEELAVTAVYVTHDLAEAFALGDRVAVVREGRIVQVGTPDELWAKPADEDLARFLGLGSLEAGSAVRPEAVAVRAVADGERGNGVVAGSVRLGPLVRVRVQLDDGAVLEAVAAGLDHPRQGDRVVVDVDPAGIIDLR